MSLSLDFQKLFENSPSLYLVLDTELKIVAVTNAYLAATMTQRNDLLGKNIFDAFPDNPDDPKATGVSNLRDSLHLVLKNKKPNSMAVQKYDIQQPVSMGGKFEVRYWSPVNTPIVNIKGEIEFILHRVEDVTEFVRLKELENEHSVVTRQLQTHAGQMENEIIERAKEIQEANKQLLNLNSELKNKTHELQRSNEDLSQFAAMAAHDIQSPFRQIGISLDIIKDRLGDSAPEEVKELFQNILNSRDGIKSLINDLLEYARVTNGQLKTELIDIRKVAEEVIELLGAPTTSIMFEGNFPSLHMDRSQVFQVFQNLISNAIKFQNGQNPEVVISAHESDDSHKFCVHDNGIGIDPKYFEKIFQVFQRLHTKDQYAGTGLGLAICKKIIERQGGKIWVESEVGKGSTFCFIVPKTIG